MPVSHLLAFLKVLEKNMHKPVYGYLNNNKLLYAISFGLRNHSNIDANSQFVDNALTSFDQNKYTTRVLLDISKAFSIIDHNSLHRKIDTYGIRGQSVTWFESYYCERKHFTTYQSRNFCLCDISGGVTEGQILIRLLFII